MELDARRVKNWFEKRCKGHPQRDVLRRSANLRDARHHRPCQLASEAPCEHSPSAAHLRPSQRHCRWRRPVISLVCPSVTCWTRKWSPRMGLCRMRVSHTRKKGNFAQPLLFTDAALSQSETASSVPTYVMPRDPISRRTATWGAQVMCNSKEPSPCKTVNWHSTHMRRNGAEIA